MTKSSQLPPSYPRTPPPNEEIFDLANMLGADYNVFEQEAFMPDKKLAQWACQKLLFQKQNPGQPFFMAVGFLRPHVSMFVPQRFYDMYPLSSLRVPYYSEQLRDVSDLPDFALRYLINDGQLGVHKALYPPGAPAAAAVEPDSSHTSLQNMAMKDGFDGHAQALQAYLASITFADECLGQLLSVLDKTGLADDTVVVLWSDHGWFLGEKLGWQKPKLWERVCRAPLIIAHPSYTPGNCDRIVSLLDLFPTLAALAPMTQPEAYFGSQLDGRSLEPLLKDASLRAPGAPGWEERPAITTEVVVDFTSTANPSVCRPQPLAYGGFEKMPDGACDDAVPFFAVRDERYRYIQYPATPNTTFREELYDLVTDPDQTANLAFGTPPPSIQAVLATMRARIPAT